MPLSTRDYAQITDELQEIFTDYSAQAIANAIGLTIFEVKETELRTYEHQILHGVAGIERVAEGGNLPRLNSEEGDNISWTQARYGVIIPITKDMRIFDLYDKMEGLVRTIVEEAWDKIDQSLADVLLYGWDTSYTDVYGESVTSTGPDSLAVFSSAHTNNTTSATFTNIITDGTNTNPALSRAAIVKSMQTGLTFTDPNGLVRPIDFNTVLVCPSLADSAHRIVHSEQISGSANWDPNQWVRGTIKEVKTWHRLESTGQGTSKSAHWFMYDSRRVGNSLKVLFKEKPSLEPAEQQTSNRDWEYPLDYYYTIGRGYPAFVRGSKGDNS